MRVSVSIAPLRYAVESLLDTNVVINVLTPDGASPETYQLTPKQVAELSESQLYVRVGSLGFENTQMRKVTQNMPHLLCVNSARGQHRQCHPPETPQHQVAGLPDIPSRIGLLR